MALLFLWVRSAWRKHWRHYCDRQNRGGVVRCRSEHSEQASIEDADAWRQRAGSVSCPQSQLAATAVGRVPSKQANKRQKRC
jgi:hypothetical protein